MFEKMGKVDKMVDQRICTCLNCGNCFCEKSPEILLKEGCQNCICKEVGPSFCLLEL